MDMEQIRKRGIRFTSINERLHIIHGTGRSRSPFANAFLVTDRVCALIDTGCGLDILTKLLDLQPIELVINSHSHPDHTAGNWLVQGICSPEIAVPIEAASSIGSADKLAPRLAGAELASCWLETSLSVTGFRDFTLSSHFSEGHEFRLGRTRLVALHTPGHLADHYCLWEPEERIVFGFDIDLSPFGGWYGNAESDLGRFRASVDRLLSLPAEVYLSSHARPVRGAHIDRRLKAYRSIFDVRRERIRALVPVNAWKGPEDIAHLSPIYDVHHPDSKTLLFYNETQMVRKHLDELVLAGELVHLDGGYRRR